MTKQELFELVAEALDVSIDTITIDSSAENIEEWDSLGHITILSMLDDATNGSSADLVDLTQAISVAELIEVLSKSDLLN